MVALVGHGDYFVVDVVSVVELDGVVDDELGIEEDDEALSEFVLLEPLGEVLAETLPLALIAKISKFPLRSLANAILLPSGDQAGPTSADEPIVRFAWPLPSAFIVKTSKLLRNDV